MANIIDFLFNVERIQVSCLTAPNGLFQVRTDQFYAFVFLWIPLLPFLVLTSLPHRSLNFRKFMRRVRMLKRRKQGNLWGLCVCDD